MDAESDLEFCQWIIDTIASSDCFSDCDVTMMEEINELEIDCTVCLANPDDCDSVFSECPDDMVPDCSGDGDCVPVDMIGDGWCDGFEQTYGADLTCYAWNDDEVVGPPDNPNDLQFYMDGGDCGDNNNSCPDDYVSDCSGDGDCCHESWVGDDTCDGADQAYGCNLLCYALDEDGDIIDEWNGNDDGDCEDEETWCSGYEFDVEPADEAGSPEECYNLAIYNYIV